MRKFFDPFKIIVLASAIALASCNLETEDPGPIQEIEREFSMEDFDRLEMGNAFQISVQQGDKFNVTATGDRRNIDDLVVVKNGSTLVIKYDTYRNRRHSTHIQITMPSLTAVNFSGATESRISGFSGLASLDVHLSGASTCNLDATATRVDLVVSGASQLSAIGSTETIIADISGASMFRGFNFPAKNARLNVSGASGARVTASESLKVIASGASVVVYRGDALVTKDVSGASSVRRD